MLIALFPLLPQFVTWVSGLARCVTVEKEPTRIQQKDVVNGAVNSTPAKAHVVQLAPCTGFGTDASQQLDLRPFPGSKDSLLLHVDLDLCVASASTVHPPPPIAVTPRDAAAPTRFSNVRVHT